LFFAGWLWPLREEASRFSSFILLLKALPFITLLTLRLFLILTLPCWKSIFSFFSSYSSSFFVFPPRFIRMMIIYVWIRIISNFEILTYIRAENRCFISQMSQHFRTSKNCLLLKKGIEIFFWWFRVLVLWQVLSWKRSLFPEWLRFCDSHQELITRNLSDMTIFACWARFSAEFHFLPLFDFFLK